VTEHLNTINIVVSQLFSIDIKLSDEDKCINLFYSLLDLRDSLVIAIGRNTTTLKFNQMNSPNYIANALSRNLSSWVFNSEVYFSSCVCTHISHANIHI